MGVTGNITEVVINDTDLVARFPTLMDYLPAPQGDWALQIAVGKSDAEEAFRVAKSLDNDRVVAVNDEDWKAILVFFTLASITRAFSPPLEWLDEADRWREQGLARMSRFLFNYDWDDDGTIDVDTDDDVRRSLRQFEIER